MGIHSIVGAAFTYIDFLAFLRCQKDFSDPKVIWIDFNVDNVIVLIQSENLATFIVLGLDTVKVKISLSILELAIDERLHDRAHTSE